MYRELRGRRGESWDVLGILWLRRTEAKDSAECSTEEVTSGLRGIGIEFPNEDPQKGILKHEQQQPS